MGDIKVLSQEIVNAILNCKEKQWKKLHLDERFVNKLLRDDVLELLDMFCTIVYYPVDDSINGFSLSGVPGLDGEIHRFVFINTNQSTAKQVFTAAHELGHIWEVDKYVERVSGTALDEGTEELVINRFAAELLMPREEFISAYESERSAYEVIENKIRIGDMLKIIVSLMNQFLVPRKAVVMRLFEIDALSASGAEVLLGKSFIPESVLEEETSQIIKQQGYVKLLMKTEKKYIDGLAELLDAAERTEAIGAEKIQQMRVDFELNKHTANEALDKIVIIEPSEGSDGDGD